MHNKSISCSDFEETILLISPASPESESGLRGNLSGPNGEIVCVMCTKFHRNSGNMMNQTKIFDGKELRCWCWVDVQVRKWENSSLLPAFDFSLNLWGP